MSNHIKEQWHFQRNFQEEYYGKISIKSEEELEIVVNPEVRSVEQQIADVEEHNRPVYEREL